MAMRLRLKLGGGWEALCAATSAPMLDDVYIDDSQDHAIRQKLEADWRSEGFMFWPFNNTKKEV